MDNQLLKKSNRIIKLNLLERLYEDDDSLITNQEIKYGIIKTQYTLDIEKLKKIFIYVLNYLINDEKNEIQKNINDILNYFDYISIDQFIDKCKVLHIEIFLQDLYDNNKTRYNNLPCLLDFNKNLEVQKDEIVIHQNNIKKFIDSINELESEEERYNVKISEYSFTLKVELVLFFIGLERILEIINIKIILNGTKNKITKEVFQIILDHYGYINNETKIIKSIDITSFIIEISTNIMQRHEILYYKKQNHRQLLNRNFDYYT